MGGGWESEEGVRIDDKQCLAIKCMPTFSRRLFLVAWHPLGQLHPSCHESELPTLNSRVDLEQSHQVFQEHSLQPGA